MQDAGALCTHLSCTVYLQTEEIEGEKRLKIATKSFELWLTSAAKTLSAHSCQHIEAEIAISWLVEVLQSPQMGPIFTNIL
jgi:hypothetical protein